MDPSLRAALRTRTFRPRWPRRRWARVGLIVIVTLVIAAVVMQRAGWLGDDEVEVGTVPAAAVDLSPRERAYYDFVAPRLRELSAQARELATLGQEKSRDLLAIRAHGDRLNELGDELDAFILANGTPDRFATVETGYRKGISLARRGMQEAQRGFLTFDWDRVARAVPVFVAGAERLETTVSDLDVAGGMATPSSSPLAT
jgi:hypothetical protein